MKRVVVNTLPALSQLGGIGRYIVEILSRLGNKTDAYDFRYYYGFYCKKFNYYGNEPNPMIGRIKKLCPNTRFIKRIANRMLMTMPARQREFDIYWEPNCIPLRGIKAKKTIVTLHDFSVFHNKQWHPQDRVDYYLNYFHNIQHAHTLVTCSQFVKEEALQRLHFKEEQIKVVPNGVNHDVYRTLPEDQLEEFALKHSIPDKFIVSLGAITPRKNLQGLIKAHRALPENIRREHKLILVGHPGWNNHDIMREIENDKQNIRYLGYMPEQDVAKLCNLATIAAYPSFYEGFGIPPLEIMACGTPVIVSNRSAMPEVCADAALYVDPDDVDSIQQQIQTALTNPELRRELREKGLRRAEKFTWNQTSEMIDCVLQEQ